MHRCQCGRNVQKCEKMSDTLQFNVGLPGSLFLALEAPYNTALLHRPHYFLTVLALSIHRLPICRLDQPWMDLEPAGTADCTTQFYIRDLSICRF